MSDLNSLTSPAPQTTLADLRTQRADAEQKFQQTMRKMSLSSEDREHLRMALAYHREVCAAFKAELSLIASGCLPATSPTSNEP